MEPSPKKKIFIKGLQRLGITLVLLFFGPSLLHLVQSNNEKPFYGILLTIAILICVLAVYFGFLGIKTIVKSIFYRED